MSGSNIDGNKIQLSPINLQLSGSFVKDGKQYLILNAENDADTNVYKHNQQDQSLSRKTSITSSMSSTSILQVPSQQMITYSQVPLPHAPLSREQPNAVNKSPSKVLVYPSLQKKAKDVYFASTRSNKPNQPHLLGNLVPRSHFFKVASSSPMTSASCVQLASLQLSTLAEKSKGDIHSEYQYTVKPRVNIIQSAVPHVTPANTAPKVSPNTKSVMQPVVPVKLVPSVVTTNADRLTKTDDSTDHDYIVRPTSLPILNLHALKHAVSAVNSNPAVSSSMQKGKQDQIGNIVIKKVETLKVKDVATQSCQKELPCVPHVKTKTEATSLGKLAGLGDFSNITIKKEVSSPIKAENSEEAMSSDSSISFARAKINIEPDCTETLIQYPINPAQTNCSFSLSDTPDFYTTVESKHKADTINAGENMHISKSQEDEFVNVWDTDDDSTDDVLLELLQSSAKNSASTRKISQLPVIHNNILIRPCYVKLERCDGFIAAGTSNVRSRLTTDEVTTTKSGRTILIVNSSDVKVKEHRTSNAKTPTMYKFKFRVSSGKQYELSGQLVRIKGREGLFLHSMFSGKSFLFPASASQHSCAVVSSSTSTSNLPISSDSNSLHINDAVNKPSSASSSHCSTTPLSYVASSIKTGTSSSAPLPSATAMCMEGELAQTESTESLSRSDSIPSKLQKCEEALESSQERIRRLKELLKKQEAELEELRTKNLFSDDS